MSPAASLALPSARPAAAPSAAASAGSQKLKVAVIAPGAGTGANAPAYAAIASAADIELEIKGQGRAPYDRYPASWPGGAPAPNLASFASELLEQHVVEASDCLVFGSRGGQVVLTTFWARCGARVPPAVVINGGCAMALPTQVQWPDEAVTFLLVGGQDNFRGRLSVEQYLADVKARVPRANNTTAVLFVNEMPHMPQGKLLAAALPAMLRAVAAWKRGGAAPHAELQAVAAAVAQQGLWSGALSYTVGAGAWLERAFGGGTPAMQQPCAQLAAVGGA